MGEPGTHEWEVRTRQSGRSSFSAAAEDSHGLSTHVSPSCSWTTHFQSCPACCMSQDVPLFTFMVLTHLLKLCCTAFLPTAPIMRPLKPSRCTQGLEYPSIRASILFAPHGCARNVD